MSSPMHRNNHVTTIETGYKNWRNTNLGGDALGSATTGVRIFLIFWFLGLFLIDCSITMILLETRCYFLFPVPVMCS